MNRNIRILVATSIVAVLALGFWLLHRYQQGSTSGAGVGNIVESALTNPVEFAKNHVTGGVGVILRMDSASGLPIVQGVGVGSPAQAAGLQVGDIVTDLNGLATTGQNLNQVVEAFRGITGGAVTVTVKRIGTTNVTCVIRRTSWNNLRKTPFNQTSPYE